MTEIALRVKRFDSAVEAEPNLQEYRVPLDERITVLDALFHVVSYVDPSLSFRCACRAGMCGSCGMVVNGREALACRTQISSLGPVVTLEPLRNLPVLKDLTVDLDPFFDKYAAVAPYLVPKSDLQEPAIIPAGSAVRGRIDAHLDCISCGLCYSACSVVALDPEYPGPAALNRAYCLTTDVRDAARDRRLDAIENRHGLWRCHSLFECTQVCPKNLAPTQAIAMLKQQAGKRRVGRLFRRLFSRAESPSEAKELPRSPLVSC